MSDLMAVIDELVEAQYEVNRYYYKKPPRPQPGPPATPKELDALARHLSARGLPFPPSYRAFLETCNGIRYFDHHTHLLTAAEVMEPVDPGLFGPFASLARFVIGQGDDSFISFDPDSAGPAGELEVVTLAGDGSQWRKPTFGEFLRWSRDYAVASAAEERANREGLPD